MCINISSPNKFWCSIRRYAEMMRARPALLASLGIYALVGCAAERPSPPAATIAPPATAAAPVAPPPVVEPPAPVLQGLRPVLDAATQQQRCAVELEAVRTAFKRLERYPGVPDLVHFLKPLSQLLRQLDNSDGQSGLYANVHPDVAVREAAEGCQRESSQIATEIGLSDALYQRLKSVDLGSRHIDRSSKRFVTEMLRDFRRAGVQLGSADQNRLRDLNERILELSQSYSRNIREDVRSIPVKRSELDGLPQDFIAALPFEASAERTVVTTDYPSFFPVMRYAHNDALRERLYRQFANRGYPDNEKVLLLLLQARYQLAALLGYPDYAAYAIERLMVGKADSAQRFIDRIDQLARPRAARDYRDQLLRLQRQYPDSQSVGEWQRYYLVNLLKEEQHGFDPKQLRQYFPYRQVRDGIFRLVERLFAIEVKPWQTETWHPSVSAYSLYADDHLIGNFYLDMYPREGKYKHAAFFSIRNDGGPAQPPLGALVCNFPDPGFGNEAGGFLDHSQVVTFLHEFGHLLHFILASEQAWITQAGIRTELDFVEAPSQMLEEWAWDYNTLRDFAINAEGQAIGVELVGRMKAARYLAYGTWVRRQGYYAALSMYLYRSNPELLNLSGDMVQLQSKYSPYPHTPGTHFYANFGHLIGYSSNYYTYMWSKVIAADMFSFFQQARTPAAKKAVAQRYRDIVLKAGGSRPAMELVESFLGRALDFSAFRSKLQADPQ